MKKCPKCSYERTQKDDAFVSEHECPRCGIIYEKELAFLARQREVADAELQRAEEEKRVHGEHLAAQEKMRIEKELKEADRLQKAGADNAPVEVRMERIVAETDLYRVEGDIALPSGGYTNALLDILNHNEDKFITLENVELAALDGSGRSWRTPALDLAKKQIRLVVPKNNS